MHLLPTTLPPSLVVLILTLLLQCAAPVNANPATIPFTDCFDDQANEAQKLNVSTVYAQVPQNSEWGKYLNLTVLGDTPQQILGLTNTSGSLSTLFTTTSVLTLNAWTNSSYLCNTLRSPSPLPSLDNTSSTFCPIPAGPFAFSVSIPWGRNRALTTLVTRLRAVDPFGEELVCIDVSTTALQPSKGEGPYGDARIILWASVALAVAYWVVVGVARVVSALGRGANRSGRGVWGKLQSGGFILASAVSGERMASSPALIRFCTPSMRDVIFHTQWCAALAMVAVEWPPFIYPLLTQAAWSTLSYNTTLTGTSTPHQWDPLSTLPYSPPSSFSNQLSDPSSPLFIDPAVPNVLFTLPQNASDGMESFAYAVGVRSQDLFPICLILFLAIIAATVVLSIFLWALDYFMVVVVFKSSSRSRPNHSNNLSRARSPAFGASASNRSALNRDQGEATTSPIPGEESKSLTGQSMGGGSVFGVGTRAVGTHRSWWRRRTDIGSFHGSVLHGNLVRILVLFHLPITIFSVYQMVQRGPGVSRVSVALAALSFTFLSVLIPLHLVLRVTLTTTNKLYDETRTLLSLGPLYNHYRHGSQMFATLLFASNLAFGVTIGAGQKSGTAQAIIILVVEVISALGTSIWLPWGSGASMGLISFLFCVARIVVAVLLVILTPTISIGPGPGGWVAYGILIILALVYLALLLMLFVKLTEAAVRIIGGAGFDQSRHVVDSGLLGALGLTGFCGSQARSKGRRKSKKPGKSGQGSSQKGSDAASYIASHPGAMAVGLGAPGPGFAGPDSRKGSTHSGPPPSVLRPEHALPRPYRENDDDEGYIMGAWQAYPLRHGYVPVADPVTTPPPPKSGFSRIGGGRSHIDTPYAIMDGTASAFVQNNSSTQGIASSSMHAIGNGSTHTFPSIGQHNQSRTTLPRPGSLLAATPSVFYDDDDPPPSLSNVARQAEYGQLPPGAMLPAHIRTKSQSAIIEDASKLHSLAALGAGNVGSNSGGGGATAGPSGNNGGANWSHAPHHAQFSVAVDEDSNDVDDDDDDSTVEEQPKKKPWYRIIRHRPNSSDGPNSSGSSNNNNNNNNNDQAPVSSALPPSLPLDMELGGLGLSANTIGDSSTSGGGSSPGSGASSTGPTRSFVVIRKPQPQSTGRLNQSQSASQLQNMTYPPGSSPARTPGSS